MNLKKHTSHKECNIDWLDYIPTHWDVKKFKHYYSSSMGNTILKEELSDAADIPVYSATERVEVLGYINNPNVLLHRDDFIIPARGNSIGHVKLVEDDCTCTQTTIYAKRLLANRINPHFVYWYQIGLRKKLYEFDNTAIPQLTVRQVKENPILCPSISEQQIIAFFLDRETARIDALIRKKERMIELLKEKRIALITQAVTKGLDPNVPMKDSGIEWLGEVPAHWIPMVLGRECKIQGGYAFDSSHFTDDGYPIVQMSNLKRGVLDFTDAKKYPYELCPREVELKEGNILIGMSGSIGETGSLGNYAIVSKDDLPCFLNQRVGRLQISHKVYSGFLSYVIQSTPFFEQIQLSVTGTAQYNISPTQLGHIWIVMPPTREQKEISEFLDIETIRIESLMRKIDDSITLLREYRASLIHHAVTGKIDLRGYDDQTQ